MSELLAFVIDDDRSLGEAYKQALELSGFRAEHIDDSTIAFSLIVEKQPDIIMLDMQMPKMKGDEVLQAIRNDERTAHIKVIVATANPQAVNATVTEHADIILQKPVSMSQIKQFATRLLSQK